MFEHFESVAMDHSVGTVTRHRVAPVPKAVKSRPGCSSMWSKACLWNVGPVCLGPAFLFSEVFPSVSHLEQWIKQSLGIKWQINTKPKFFIVEKRI